MRGKGTAIIISMMRGKGRGGMEHDRGDMMDYGHTAHRSEAEDAYEQVRDGLQTLAADYPDARRLLSEFEALWAKWMGGGAQEPGPAPVAGAMGEEAEET
jgi:hypothetical protein